MDGGVQDDRRREANGLYLVQHGEAKPEQGGAGRSRAGREKHAWPLMRPGPACVFVIGLAKAGLGKMANAGSPAAAG
jgi:hypothetical protein